MNLLIPEFALFIIMGDVRFNINDNSGNELEQLINLWHRLFKRISIGKFDFDFDVDATTLEAIHKITPNFMAEEINFIVDSGEELENAISVMAAFPKSKVRMTLLFLPEADRLSSLSRVEDMTIVKDQA